MAVTGTPITIADVPVSVAEAKHHLRITHSDDDTYIETLLLAATHHCEEFQRRKYLEQTVVEKFDSFATTIRPRYSPLISINSIQYVDTASSTQTLDAAEYDVDTTEEPGRITPAYTKSWPATRDMMNAVTLTYLAGYGTADQVPDEFKQAILLLVGHLYQHRMTVTDERLIQTPEATKALLWPKRILF